MTTIQTQGRGLFVGLITLDAIYQVEQIPQPNQKIVAQAQLLVAGGPATNAAIAFASLGGHATLVTSLGQHPVQHLVRSDLADGAVTLLDLHPDREDPPPLSSILVTASTGDRAVVSRNAVQRQAQASDLPTDLLQAVDIVLIDGHQMAVGAAIAHQAQARGIPVVVDAGSWKPGFETVLSAADYVIASANFQPPDCATEPDIVAFVAALGCPYLAITHGADPIHYWALRESRDRQQLPVPRVSVRDTLGAGDILHGAFCAALRSPSQAFASALTQAAQVASHTCQWFGPRQGLRQLQSPSPDCGVDQKN